MIVPFVDLQAGYQTLQQEIDEVVSRVLKGGWYILGSEVDQFEQEFASYCQVSHAVGVASGTDAILLALKACGIGPGAEVITVSHTAVATVAAIELSGARAVMVDVDAETYTIDPRLVEAAITPETRAILPVHLYGQPAEMERLSEIARQNGLFLIEDCAQAHGARYRGKVVGSMGHVAAFSFYPTKNLGAFGDGGMVVTSDPDLDLRLRQLRQYGWQQRYISERRGYNSRLDELQAAILRVKLRHLDAFNKRRRGIAEVYQRRLSDAPVLLPQEADECEHVYHLYVIQSERRDALQAHLQASGIGAAIHYPVPVHRQPAYDALGYRPGSLPVTESLASHILSLPMYPEMTSEQADIVAESIRQFWRNP